MHDRIWRLRDRGYIGAALAAACVLVIALPIRVLLAITAGGALVGLVRWEATSASNHSLVSRVAGFARRLWLGLFVLVIVFAVLIKFR